MKYRRKLLVIVLAVLFTLAFRTWNQYSASQEKPWFNTQWQSLWTQITFKAQTDSLQYMRLCDSISHKYLDFSENFKSRSALDSIFFESKANDTLKVNLEQYQILKFAEEAYDKTHGAIHPGIANLIQAYGLEYGQTKRVPPDSVIQNERNLLQSLPYKTIDNYSIVVLQEKRHLAFGAFSKGFALEWARKFLLKEGIENFWLEIGGDLVLNGNSIEGRPWKAGIQNPLALDQLQGILAFEDSTFKSLATSGNYRQFFTDSLGNKHHHILDPKTARSVRGKASVSVLAPDGIQADLWATAFFVLSIEEGKKILAQRPDLAAFYILEDGSTWASKNFKTYTSLENE